MLELLNISQHFPSGNDTLIVLEQVNFTLLPGQLVALLGQSGAGKSTLLQIAGLLQTPSHGQVIVDGKIPKSETERTMIRRHQMGFVYQYHHLLPELTALENVMLPLWIQKQSASKERASDILINLGLKDRMSHFPRQLSGGEQQRVAIARALVHQPKILLADEPTGNLDPTTAQKVFELLLKQSQEQNTACLVATHNVELAQKMHKIIWLEGAHLKGHLL